MRERRGISRALSANRDDRRTKLDNFGAPTSSLQRSQLEGELEN
jgi:hypothetical protein